MGGYTPGRLGANFVVPAARGLKGLYLRMFGIPDVRTQLTASHLMWALEARSFRSILDVGCGNGLLTCLMGMACSGATVVGVEIESEGLEYAARLARQNGLDNVSFRLGNAERDEVGGQYDLVTALAVFQFIHDVDGLLGRLNAALEPGGWLVLQLSSADARQWLMRFGSVRRALPDFHEARSGFTLDDTAAMLDRSGFEAIEVRPIVKGPAAVAKEIFYALSTRPLLKFALCPVLNWVTVFDRRYPGRGNGLFVVARKARDVAERRQS